MTYVEGFRRAGSEDSKSETPPRFMDAAEFAKTRLGFDADEPQREMLLSKTKRAILNCTRQWGKSSLAAAKAVYRAFMVAKCTVVVASPGERQSGEFIRKAEEMVERLDIRPRGDGYNKLSLLLPNGSRIVGLPASEPKVRGFRRSRCWSSTRLRGWRTNSIAHCDRCWRWGTAISG